MTHPDRMLNRTERLFALVLLLQNRPNMTTRDLADHFGVSRRTIFRDLRALSESGVPLTYAEGGGYEILEGYQLPPLMFSAREAATLLMGTKFVQLQPDASLQADADQVALKIRSVLPEPVQDYIDRLQESIVIDPYSVHAVQPDDHEKEGKWYRLSEAVVKQKAVQMDYYVESRNEVTRRKVQPFGLVYYSDHWNLIAYDQLRRDFRNFRVDHIRSMRVLEERFKRPADFDLAAFLKERGAGQERHRIAVRFSPRAYRWARPKIPAEIEEEREHDEGIEVTFYFENLEYVAAWLLGYGTQAVVLEPEALRQRVREQALQMARMYEPAAVGHR